MTTSIPPIDFLALSGGLLAIGIFGILTRRNFILLLISVEIAINAAILNFVAFSAFAGTSSGVSGQAAAVVLIGLAIVLALNRLRGSINVAEATQLKL